MICVDPCKGVTCSMPGEQCSDGECKCRENESCAYHEINSTSGWRHYIRGDAFCDPSDGLCKCKNKKLGTMTICSEENKFCTVQGCKCSRVIDEYVVEGELQGTCKLGSDRCFNGGPDSNLLCDGK